MKSDKFEIGKLYITTEMIGFKKIISKGSESLNDQIRILYLRKNRVIMLIDQDKTINRYNIWLFINNIFLYKNAIISINHNNCETLERFEG